MGALNNRWTIHPEGEDEVGRWKGLRYLEWVGLICGLAGERVTVLRHPAIGCGQQRSSPSSPVLLVNLAL